MSQVAGQTTRGARMMFIPLHNPKLATILTVATPSGGNFTQTLAAGTWRVVVGETWLWDLTVPDDNLLYPCENLITARNRPPAPTLASLGVATVDYVDTQLAALQRLVLLLGTVFPTLLDLTGAAAPYFEGRLAVMVGLNEVGDGLGHTYRFSIGCVLPNNPPLVVRPRGVTVGAFLAIN